MAYLQLVGIRREKFVSKASRNTGQREWQPPDAERRAGAESSECCVPTDGRMHLGLIKLAEPEHATRRMMVFMS